MPTTWMTARGMPTTVEVLTVINDDTARDGGVAVGTGPYGQPRAAAYRRIWCRGRSGQYQCPFSKSRSGPLRVHCMHVRHGSLLRTRTCMLALKYGMNRQEMVDKILFGYGYRRQRYSDQRVLSAVHRDLPNSVNMIPEKAAHHMEEVRSMTSRFCCVRRDNSFPGAHRMRRPCSSSRCPRPRVHQARDQARAQ